MAASCATPRSQHPQPVLKPRLPLQPTRDGHDQRRCPLPTYRQSSRGRSVGRIVVRLRGALDVTAAPALRERLIGLLHPGMGLLVLDLSRVPSCDPGG